VTGSGSFGRCSGERFKDATQFMPNALSRADAILRALADAGRVIVPAEATMQMRSAGWRYKPHHKRKLRGRLARHGRSGAGGRQAVYLGIDPGIDGALAVWVPVDRPGGPSLALYDMPFAMGEVAGKPRKRLDRAGLRNLLDTFAIVYHVDLVVIEKVNAMPKQSGMFTFGFGVGATMAMLEERRFRIVEVTPSVWKRDLKVPKDKKLAMARAGELFPNDAQHFFAEGRNGRVPRPDRAEAAMLALWAERHAR